MTQRTQIDIDYDKEIGRVDMAIVALGAELEDLVYKRYELVARKHKLDAQELMNCIVENNLMSQEVIGVISSASMRKAH